jgi:tRNA (mo5U34)-methyltransferase
VYRLAGRAERYDLVLFMGVFYHLRHPLLGLEIVARKASRLLVFQSLTTADEAVAADARRDLDLERRGRLDMPGWPRLAFVEKTLCGDPTNWWVPNHAAILALLRSVGMEVLVQPDHEIYLCRPEPRLAEQARWLQQETRLAAAAAGGG